MKWDGKAIFDRIGQEPGITELFNQTDICPICEENEIGYELSNGDRICSNCIYARYMTQITEWTKDG